MLALNASIEELRGEEMISRFFRIQHEKAHSIDQTKLGLEIRFRSSTINHFSQVYICLRAARVINKWRAVIEGRELTYMRILP